jgi:hypothetical protein
MSDDQSPTPTAILITALKRFLGTDTPGVICIKGPWGVGKTYTWGQTLIEAKRANALALDSYSYVSLFGLETLEQVRTTIFENTTRKDAIGTEASLETFLEGSDGVLDSFTQKWGTKLLGAIPGLKDVGAVIQSATFLTVSKRIICIDDVERRGKGLRLVDILGLISFMSERRKCKVVLILNDEQLAEQDKADLAKYSEKVIDTSLLFSPTSEECAAIAVNGDDPTSLLLRECCIRLRISNIRIIVKIARFVSEIQPTVKDLDVRVIQQAVKSLTLFGLIYYSIDQTKASDDESLLEFILMKRGRYLFGTTNAKTDQEREWDQMLDRYEYGRPDAFDFALYSGMKVGYFDAELIHQLGQQLESRFKAERAKDSWSVAWGAFQESFDDDEPEVMDKFVAAFEAHFSQMAVGDLSNVITIFKQFDRAKDAAKLLQLFMNERQEHRDFYKLEGSTLTDTVTDPDVIAAFSKRFDELTPRKPPEEILLSIYKNQGWEAYEIDQIASLSVDNYYRLFRRIKGIDLARIVRTALEFRGRPGRQEYCDIGRKAEEALKRIATENRLNRERVRRLGVKLED